MYDGDTGEHGYASGGFATEPWPSAALHELRADSANVCFRCQMPACSSESTSMKRLADACVATCLLHRQAVRPFERSSRKVRHIQPWQLFNFGKHHVP